MKRNSPINSRRGRRLVSAPAFAALVLGAALLVALLWWREPLSGLMARALEPALRARNALGATENARLRAELEAAQARALDRGALYAENLALKARLGRTDARPDAVLAAVLMHSPGVPYDSLLIDAGALHGIAEGDFVSAGGTALIGRVREVYADSARVVLFSSPGEIHEAMLSREGQAGVPLRLEGQGAGALWARVPAGTLAQAGDIILVSGIAGGISARVTAVERPEGATFETLHVRLPANPNTLRTVEVWRASASPAPQPPAAGSGEEASGE